MALTVNANAEIYKYVDKNGITHYTDNPATIPLKYRQSLKQYHEKKVTPPKPYVPAKPTSVEVPHAETTIAKPKPAQSAIEIDKAVEDARLKKEARLKQEANAARLKAANEARMKAAEEARLKKEARLKQDAEAARLKAADEARMKAAEEARLKKEAEEARLKQEAEAAKLKAA
ncbi:MAG: DUF4124 domain-containing protein, partial [Deltaproteobacteria bacterium]|nr:DUF4124 domain-containing protein [Deltaproteobacteria bacterium]